MNWMNRIVGTANVDPKTLLPHESNWRGHPPHQAKALAGAIAQVGFLKSVTVSKRTGKILDGHLRVEEAIRQQQSTISVEYVDLTAEEELVALATIDPIAAMADAQKEALKGLLATIKVSDDNLGEMLKDLGKKNAVAAQSLSSSQAGCIFQVLVKCKDEAEQQALLQRFISEGLECRALIA